MEIVTSHICNICITDRALRYIPVVWDVDEIGREHIAAADFFTLNKLAFRGLFMMWQMVRRGHVPMDHNPHSRHYTEVEIPETDIPTRPSNDVTGPLAGPVFGGTFCVADRYGCSQPLKTLNQAISLAGMCDHMKVPGSYGEIYRVSRILPSIHIFDGLFDLEQHPCTSDGKPLEKLF